MITSVSRRLTLVLLATSAIVGGAYAIYNVSDLQHGDTGAPYNNFGFGVVSGASGASLIEWYPEPEALTRSVDLVVLAHTVDVLAGPIYAPDGDEVRYASIRLEVIETLAGVRVEPEPSGPVEVQVMLGDSATPEELMERLKGKEAIWFLRSAARTGSPDQRLEKAAIYYAPTPESLIVNDEGRAELPWVGEEASESQEFSRLDGTAPFDDVVSSVRSYGDLGQLAIDLLQDGNPKTPLDLRQELERLAAEQAE